MEIGRRLRELRLAQGLGQMEIARRAGFLSCYISRIECGRATPQLAVLERWASALGVPLYAVFLEDLKFPIPPPPRRPAKMSTFEKKLFKLMQKMKLAERRIFVSFAELLAEDFEGHGGSA